LEVDCQAGVMSAEGRALGRQLVKFGWLVLVTALATTGLYVVAEAHFQQAGDTPAPMPEEMPPPAPGWKKGIGWGPVWGENDALGSLNHMTDATRKAALALADQGKVIDLGVEVQRESFRDPESGPIEVLTHRSPQGYLRMAGPNPCGMSLRTVTVILGDNAGTHLLGLGRVTIGDRHTSYNTMADAQIGGDFGVSRVDAASIPPIVARGVMLDIAALKGVPALAPGYSISRQDVDDAIKRQNIQLKPGDVVLFRTGTMSFWNGGGKDWDKIKQHGSAGITLGTAKYLVQTFGSMIIGCDTPNLEVVPAPEGAECPMPVHKYLLVEQGVPIAAMHNLEQLAASQTYEFCYMCTTNKLAGTTSGFALRPVAMD
jgi:kynurenine formamidase